MAGRRSSARQAAQKAGSGVKHGGQNEVSGEVNASTSEST
jgi:hypothetical protein